VRGKITHGISVELMLAGHTHGGQLGVQALGFELTPATFLYKQYAGLYADLDTDTPAAEQHPASHPAKQHLYVNRGVGSTGVPFRLGIPPEITVLTLRRA
jgi:predicted MPP superfamily phosphohydrolase